MLDALPDTRLDATHHDGTGSLASRCAPCGRIWAVAYTHSQAERWAEAGLRRAGYETYLPLAITRRRDNAIRSLWHRVEVPAYPRYLFVVLSGPWTPIRYCPGVADLVWQEPGKPGTVPDAAVEALRAAEAERAASPPPNATWAPGAAVALSDGPLAGHPAVVLSVSRETARIAVLLFGELRQVSSHVSNLTARD